MSRAHLPVDPGSEDEGISTYLLHTDNKIVVSLGYFMTPHLLYWLGRPCPIWPGSVDSPITNTGDGANQKAHHSKTGEGSKDNYLGPTDLVRNGCRDGGIWSSGR